MNPVFGVLDKLSHEDVAGQDLRVYRCGIGGIGRENASATIVMIPMIVLGHCNEYLTRG